MHQEAVQVVNPRRRGWPGPAVHINFAQSEVIMNGDNAITILFLCALVVFGLRLMVKTTFPRRSTRDAVKMLLASKIVKWLS